MAEKPTRRNPKEERRSRQFDNYIRVRGECYAPVWEAGPRNFLTVLEAAQWGDFETMATALEHTVQLRDQAVALFEQRKKTEDIDPKETVSGLCCRPLYDFIAMANAIRHQLSHPLESPAQFTKAFVEVETWRKENPVRVWTDYERIRNIHHAIALYLAGGVAGSYFKACTEFVVGDLDLVRICSGQVVPTNRYNSFNSSIRIDPLAHHSEITFRISDESGYGCVDLLMPWGKTIAAWGLEHLNQLILPLDEPKNLKVLQGRLSFLRSIESNPLTPWVGLEIRYLEAMHERMVGVKLTHHRPAQQQALFSLEEP